MAARWVSNEPGNLRALDLLATSYRKLADERKLVEAYGAARESYLKAIAINRKVLSELAIHDPKGFDAVFESAKGALSA